MATREEIYAAIRNADAAGDSASVQKLGAYLQTMSAPKKAVGPSDADRELYAPTNGMSGPAKFMAGMGKAIVDTGRGISGLFTDNNAEIEESRKLDKSLMDTGAGFAGNVTGHVGMALAPGGALKGAATVANAAKATGAAERLGAAGSALIAPTSIKGAAAVGAGMGAVQPALSWEERAGNAGMGGVAGGAGTAALNGLARVIKPNTAPGVNALMAEGVTPTPGQILGGGFKRAEEALGSLPFAGDFVRAGQMRAAEGLGTAAFNRALAPVGEKLPAGLKGSEAVAYVGETLGKKYDALLPKLTTQMDGQTVTELSSLQNMMANGSIDPAKAKQFDAIIQSQVLSKFQQGANGAPTLTGQTMKQIETDLGQLASRFGRSLDPDQQLVGDALQEVQSILRQTVQRSNPQHAPELKQLNEGWANFKRVQKAASSVAAEDGVFSPAQLHNAVKATDRSKDKARFAEGNALMQDLSRPGKNVLGAKLPDSGTPYRLLVTAGLPLAGAAGVGSGNLDTTTGLAMAAPLLYSRAGQNALANALTKRPAIAAPAANALRRIAPYTAVPVAADTTTRRQGR
jgi:hypothetical protein